MWVARLLTPTRDVVVVAGYPQIEGNAVETVRALLVHYTGKVVWIDGLESGRDLARFGFTAGIGKLVPLRKNSFRAVFNYVTASATFVTHGIYGLPQVVPRKPTIYLGHGEALKRCLPLFPSRVASGRPVDYLVGNTKLYAQLYNTVGAKLILSGYPRNDAMGAEAGDRALSELGIDPATLFVLWMPSFRQSKVVSLDRSYVDTTDKS